MEHKVSQEVSILQGPEFKTKATPKVVTDAKDLFLFQCECGNAHMRHAGYVEMLIPFVHGDGEKSVGQNSEHVNICVRCKKSYLWYKGQMYDISALVDVEGWEVVEREAQKMTGPGGDC